VTFISSQWIDAFALGHILHIPYTTSHPQTMKSEAGRANRQLLFSSRQDGCFYLATLLEPTHHRHTHMLSERPSVIPLDWQRPQEWLRWTLLQTIELHCQQHSLDLTRRGSEQRTVPSGVNSWGQLCPSKDLPLDNNDDVYLWCSVKNCKMLEMEILLLILLISYVTQ